jgi:hypothetical protein
MKQPVVLFLSILAVINIGKAESVFSVMQRVNKEINGQADIPPSWNSETYQATVFPNPISLHLSRVEETLRKRNTAHLNSNQIQNRLRLLDVLHTYQISEAYPQNIQYAFQTPIFIDTFNNYCAVGWLMHSSGFESLANEIAAKQNLAYVPEIKNQGLTYWQEWSGFSIDELAWIQPGYPPSTPVNALLGGTNGTVHDIIEGPFNYLYAAGSFSEADGFPCSNIAMYLPGFAGYLWTNLGDGTNGRIRCLESKNNTLFAGGDFTAPADYVAKYENGNWLPLGNGLNGPVYDLEWYNDTLYAAGNFLNPLLGGLLGYIARWNGSDWEFFEAITNGPVNRLFVADNKLYLGGTFSTCGGMETKNLAAWDGQAVETFGNSLDMPVNAIAIWNDTLLTGGALKFNDNRAGLMKWNGTDWESMLSPYSFYEIDSTGSIYDLDVLNGRLLLSGELNYYAMMGNFGRGIVEYVSQFEMSGYVYVDSSVYVSKPTLSGIYFGGAFLNNFSTALNHIAVADDVLTSTEKQQEQKTESVLVFPNPSNEAITIQFEGKWANYSLFSIDGREILRGRLQQQGMIPAQQAGIYLLNVESERGNDTIKVVFKP